MSILVKYSDIAIGAKEDFGFFGEEYLPQSNTSIIGSDVLPNERYDIPFELNSLILDGGANFLPEDELSEIGFISEQVSDENGDFESPIIMNFVSNNTYTSAGIALSFDSVKGVFATHIKIEWYNNDALLDEAEFFPDSPQYFCNRTVNFYNKISISFFSLNLPKNRLRFNGIEYGLVVTFGGDELRSAKIIQEIDPISTNIPINVFDFSIESKKNIDFSFQTKQPVEVYFNGEKKATSFVRTAKRKTKTMWQIQSEDYIGLMDSVPFVGGIYNKKNAAELISEIMSSAKVPYETIGDTSSLSVTGYIPYSSCRDALMQVLFAIGMVADTSNSDKVKLFYLDQNVSQEIEKNRILQGQNFEDETRVTAVELTAHAYSELSESIVAYEADKSGTGTNVFVLFTEPLHHLSITNGSIVESGVNYAVINANSGCKLNGKKYEHSKFAKRKNNPLVLSTDIENVVAIEGATLVSSDNVDKVLDLCYNYIVNTEKTAMKIVDRRNDAPTTVGDLISYETEYLGKKQGRIIKQTFSLVGGILSKDSVVR